ncbi:hypothetical protein SCACP_09810 [Sporomusa carbonis]|uniref:hypothetical protein n=1 Tax=Sporomusa carbonis TaxID=3076075 RepID=UPI003A726B02
MDLSNWCEHAELTSKYTLLRYNFDDKEVLLRVQTWVCPLCGIHGADTEMIRLGCDSLKTEG